MIPGVDLTTVLTALGYGVAVIIFAETGLMIGFFLPGDSLLFTAGALTGLGKLNVNIWLLAAIFFAAAILGNTSGYLIGKHAGRRLFRRKDSKFFKQEYLHSAEKFYEKHGAAAVILAQFMPIIRTFNPIVTGISKMHYAKFIGFNIIGAFIWTVGVTLLGFFSFKAFGALINPEKIDLYLLPIIVLIVVISLLPAIIGILRKKENRAKIAGRVRRIFHKD
ncbi:MAG: VTT domain-containing protein [Candidatus Nomurabacteria bacterium]|nr:VTT domain-containing protein [Candidatus Nomurabacteria bacterium]